METPDSTLCADHVYQVSVQSVITCDSSLLHRLSDTHLPTNKPFSDFCTPTSDYYETDFIELVLFISFLTKQTRSILFLFTTVYSNVFQIIQREAQTHTCIMVGTTMSPWIKIADLTFSLAHGAIFLTVHVLWREYSLRLSAIIYTHTAWPTISAWRARWVWTIAFVLLIITWYSKNKLWVTNTTLGLQVHSLYFYWYLWWLCNFLLVLLLS